MRVLVLGSGSSGNALLFEHEGARLMVDAGLSPTVLAERMRALGGDLFPRAPSAVLVTHHHGDHIAKTQSVARAFGAGRGLPRGVPVLFHDGIDAPRLRSRLDVAVYSPGRPYRVGPFLVESMWVPHDAPQVALRVTAGEQAFGVATDLGEIEPRLATFLGDCDAALVEANHCPELLEIGPYPPHLRRRVRGPLGHLANAQTAAFAAHLAGARGARLARLYLGHVSRANNTPDRALSVVRASAGPIAVEVVPHGAPRALVVERSGRPGRAQLALPFETEHPALERAAGLGRRSALETPASAPLRGDS